MILETERLILRPWNKDDLEVLYELAKNPYVGPPCGWDPHKSMEESKDVLEDILMNDYTFAVVLKSTGKVVGDISIMPYCESRYPENENQGEIGFWLGYEFWGNGYIPEACRRLIAYGFEELELEKIWCAHNDDNYNSRRVQEKCGFILHHLDSYYSKAQDKRKSMCVNCIEKKDWEKETE